MEIVRGGGGLGEGEGAKALGFYRDHVVLILQHAVDEEELLVHDEDAVPHKKLRGDDGVGDAGFVLKAEEYEAFRGAGALAGNHAASDADGSAVRQSAELNGGADPLTL